MSHFCSSACAPRCHEGRSLHIWQDLPQEKWATPPFAIVGLRAACRKVMGLLSGRRKGKRSSPGGSQKLGIIGTSLVRQRALKALSRNRRCSVGGVPLAADPRMERLRRGLQIPVQRGSLPGLAAAVFVDGRLRMLEETGYADIQARTAMTKDKLVRLYSMTKCVIAAAVMQLVDGGLLSLDDELSAHLSDFASVRVIMEGDDGLPNWNTIVPPCRPILIRHLLTHTSGISCGLALGLDGPKRRGAREKAWASIYASLVQAVDRGEIHDLAAWVHGLACLPLVDHPGNSYSYGYSYDILGHLIELKSGKTLAMYLQDHIFRPLRMRDTCWEVNKKMSQRLAVLYRYTKSARFGGDGRRRRLVSVDPPCRGTPSLWAARCKVPSGGGGVSSLQGGLLSTLDDYAKFLLAVTSGGAHPATGSKILSRESAQAMVADQTELLRSPGGPLPPLSAHPYSSRGLGLSCIGELQRKGCPAWGHWFDGIPGVRLWGGAASCAFKYDPNGGCPILVIVMTQVLPQEDGAAIKGLLVGVRGLLHGKTIARATRR